jgi:hypothetical protein
MTNNTQTSDNRILTDEELNDVSGGRTNGENPFVQTVLDHSTAGLGGWAESTRQRGATASPRIRSAIERSSAAHCVVELDRRTQRRPPGSNERTGTADCTKVRCFSSILMRSKDQHVRKVPLPDSCTAATSNNVRCIHVPAEKVSTGPIADGLGGAFECNRLDAAYLFERRQVAGAVPNAFLKAREKAASEL